LTRVAFRNSALTNVIGRPHTGLVTPDKRLGLVLAINLAMVLSLLLVGLLAHSLGVLASRADYLGDALGTGLSLAALRISRDKHGHPRATSYAALATQASCCSSPSRWPWRPFIGWQQEHRQSTACPS
jgi:hypothetical protein